MDSVFEYKDYKKFLRFALEKKFSERKGIRSDLARAMGCQPGYVSKVLNGDAPLSLEQADAANHYLGHNEEESQHFLMLVELARAGTPSLRKHLGSQVEQSKQRYLNLKNRYKISDQISEREQMIYYGTWQFAAVHTAVALGACRTKEAIAKRLRLTPQRTSEVLEFLTATGLVLHEKGEYRQSKTHTHLAKDSPLISKHHINWRMRAIESLESESPYDLHYSSVASLSREALQKIKSIVVKALDQTRDTINGSDDETMCSLSIDLFEM